jgi:hypothetical protein
LLSPAIVAVWIAIRRSSQAPALSTRLAKLESRNVNPADAHESAAESDALPLRMVLKPERMRLANSTRTISIQEPALVAQAAV